MKAYKTVNTAAALIAVLAASATGQFSITYFDNYNYETEQWDGWQSATTPLDAWDAKYLPIDPAKTEFTDDACASIDVFDLRTGFFSQDDPFHETGTRGDDWNPLRSIGDQISGQSPCHVFAALFTGWVYLTEGDVLELRSDDDAYVFLDRDTAWGDQILSIDHINYFDDIDPYIVPAELEGYHHVTVKFAERRDIHSGIEINLNGEPLSAVCPINVVIDIKPGSCPNPLNVEEQGVLPVAIPGAQDFDVSTLDPASIRLEGVVPLRWSYEDVSTPVVDAGDECACTTAGPDGCLDLTLKYSTQDIVEALGHVNDGDVVSLILTAEDIDGHLAVGADCVIVIAEKHMRPSEGLVGHWKLDETDGFIAFDSTDNQNDGLLVGDPVWQPYAGMIDGALLLDGEDDFVSLPIGSLIAELTNCTIMAWVNSPGDGGDWQRIFDFGDNTDNNMFLTPNAPVEEEPGVFSRRVRFAITINGSGEEEQATAPGGLSPGWNHVAVTIDAEEGIATLYLDGTAAASNPAATLTPSDLGATSNNWLGASQYEWDPYYKGLLDDFRIYDQVLSSDEIEAAMGGE